VLEQHLSVATVGASSNERPDGDTTPAKRFGIGNGSPGLLDGNVLPRRVAAELIRSIHVLERMTSRPPLSSSNAIGSLSPDVRPRDAGRMAATEDKTGRYNGGGRNGHGERIATQHG